MEDVTKPPAEEEPADSDEAPTAVVDAAADSDDDEARDRAQGRR